MSRLKLWFRNQVTDRANAGTRRRIGELIPTGSKVLELGCSNGRLLMELSPRLHRGLGVDLDAAAVAWGRRKLARVGHVDLVVGDIGNVGECLDFEPDVVVACLVLHELPGDMVVDVLEQLSNRTTLFLIADFVEPESVFQKMVLHLDEMMARHYRRYLAYRDRGGMPALLREAGLTEWDELDAGMPVVKVFRVPSGGRS